MQENIEMCGIRYLRAMSRLYVHLSKDIETASKVGRRHGAPVILKIHSEDMYKDGFKFICLKMVCG